MTTTIVHISDLHFRGNWEEDQGLVLKEFFIDLKNQLEKVSDRNRIFVAFSGDIVYAGSGNSNFNIALSDLNKRLGEIGISRDNIIISPGNHDICRESVQRQLVNHESVVSNLFGEKEFNDYVRSDDCVFREKFKNYVDFEKSFSAYGAMGKHLGGQGHSLGDGIGIYCLNTALCSSGGLAKGGVPLLDEGRLCIDTRSIYEWANSTSDKFKIILMHHPLSWLSEWAKKDLITLLKRSFSLRLSGHTHDQDFVHSVHTDCSLVELLSPALLTDKHGDLGYSLVEICPDRGVLSVSYRQWTKNKTFRSGVNFSNTDDGRIEVFLQRQSSAQNRDQYRSYLQERLDRALAPFPGQPLLFQVPKLSRRSEADLSSDRSISQESGSIEPESLIADPCSTLIKAPPQFGLTCLAHYLRLLAWNIRSEKWLYIDIKGIKLHTLDSEIDDELHRMQAGRADVCAIVVDSWSNQEKDASKLIAKLRSLFPKKPMYVMQSLEVRGLDDDLRLADDSGKVPTIFLRSLSRNGVRSIVKGYLEKKNIGEEDKVVSRIVSDLDVLNLHRTPLNCLTLLMASEVEFEESPVNRAEMIKRVLFILFNFDVIPTYKSKPDLKDCEYVLGRFCEILLRRGDFEFSREEFYALANEFCRSRLIDLEISVLFDVLYSSGIIVSLGSRYHFRFTYWIYYFLAQRMHQDADFARYILEDKRYASFPEVMEFYTGSDRRRDDALRVLITDIGEICAQVEEKCGLPPEINPYQILQWKSSEETLKRVHDEIGDEVMQSRLPDVVKDQFADKPYQAQRPYDQKVRTILNEYSMVLLMRSLSAAARALRNSDFADPAVRKELLQVIMRGMAQISRVLVAIGPLLAQEGYCEYDGQGFFLDGSFSDVPEKRFIELLSVIPKNVVSWYSEDLYSKKIGSLLMDYLSNETDPLKRHEMMILLIIERPVGWRARVEDYVGLVSKNSFYLNDVFSLLRSQYKYSFASRAEVADMRALLKMCMAKHELGVKRPGKKVIESIKDMFLPSREVDG